MTITSSLWWEQVVEAGNAFNINYPFLPRPVWRLMSGSTSASISDIQNIESSSWDGYGLPALFLFESSSTNAPSNGAVIKFFPSGFPGPSGTMTPDTGGFTSISVVLTDINEAIYEPEYDFGATVEGVYNLNLFRPTWPAQFSQSAASDLVAVKQSGRASFTASLTSVSYSYATTDTSASIRRGLIINASAGSPQITIEPVSTHPLYILQGDIWFVSSGTNRPSGWYFADLNSNGVVTRRRVIGIRDEDTNTSSIIDRFLNNPPSQSYLAVNSIGVNEWFLSVGPTGSNLNSGWRNATWGGGIWMSDPNTVAISGSNINFYIPSGAITASNGALFETGSVRISSGNLIISGAIFATGSVTLSSSSLNITSGNLIVSGDDAQFVVSGTNAAIRLQGKNVLTVIVSGTSSQSISPPPPNGTMFVDTTNFFVSVYENNQWWLISSGSVIGPIDGGYW